MAQAGVVGSLLSQLAGLWPFRVGFGFKAQAGVVGSLLSQLAGMWPLRDGSFISGVGGSC